MQAEQARRSDRLMWLSADRVLYAGLLGETSSRTLGGWAMYVSLDEPHSVSIDGGPWECGELIVVPPFVPHRLMAGSRWVCNVTVEAESVDPAALPAFLTVRAGVVEAPLAARRVREVYAHLLQAGRDVDLAALDFDQALFGQALAPRRIEPRIAAVLAQIKRDPASQLTAEEAAASVDLSFSRFLHLFKQETGSSFRALRTWKRARSLLQYVTRQSSLTDVALDAGYPDSTHFSHSIRQFYGLKPRDIFAGSRRLALYNYQERLC